MKDFSGHRSIRYSALLYLIVFLGVHCISDQHTTAEEKLTKDLPEHTVYVLSNNFHTGLIIPMDDESRQMLIFSPFFVKHRSVDIGWGDEVFYQAPDFSYCTGARALSIPSSSVLRVEGFNADIADAVVWSNHAIKFTLNAKQFARLCEFVNNSFIKDKDGNLIVDTQREGGEIIFFKSKYSYCLLNTCNTWIAKSLHYAGLRVSPHCVITAGSLFRRLEKVGEKLK